MCICICMCMYMQTNAFTNMNAHIFVCVCTVYIRTAAPPRNHELLRMATIFSSFFHDLQTRGLHKHTLKYSIIPKCYTSPASGL